LLVHWLYNTQPDAFAAYQVKLTKGVDPTVAWSDSFQALAGKDLDQEIQQYTKFGKFTDVPVPIKGVTAEQAKKPITEADIGAILAQLASTAGTLRNDAALKQEARQEIDHALTLEPGNTLALRLLRLETKVPEADVLARLRQQVARRPDDGEAWLMLGELLDMEAAAEREAALRRAVALMPRSARAYKGLAWMLVSTKRAEEALPLATKAAMLSPWDAPVLDTYAATLFAVGRCPDALNMQKRAVDLVPESADRGSLLPFATKVAEYSKACAEPPAPPPP
jgi:tetratricopeptide (TPR) repeat protein